MSLVEIKNYFFAYLFDFILFGAFSTLIAAIVFGSIYYYFNKAEVKNHLEEKKLAAKNLPQQLPKLQQVAPDYKYIKIK